MMRFVDHGATGLERLAGERRAEARRAGRTGAGEGAATLSDPQPSTEASGENLRVP